MPGAVWLWVGGVGGGSDLYRELEFYGISGVGLRQSITFREDELRSRKPFFHATTSLLIYILFRSITEESMHLTIFNRLYFSS